MFLAYKCIGFSTFASSLHCRLDIFDSFLLHVGEAAEISKADTTVPSIGCTYAGFGGSRLLTFMAKRPDVKI